MLIASSTNTKTGRRTLYLGLEAENMERLAAGQPIIKHLNDLGDVEVLGLQEWDVVILGPSDTATFVAAVSPTHPDASG